MARILLTILPFLLLPFSVYSRNISKEDIDHFLTEIVNDQTNNILPYWEKYTVDPSGGFYGTVTREGKPVADAPKGEILNARILWTFSIAYKTYGKTEYKQLADRAQRYFIDNFIDPEYGGVYVSLKSDGSILDSDKKTDGQAYAIYGLAEHFRSTGNLESLQQAISLFHTVEKNASDPKEGGYFDSFKREWGKPVPMGGRNKVLQGAVKSMNTHLHILEAYTTLYKVWRNDTLARSLRSVIEILANKVYNPATGHQRLYFDADWKQLGDIDSYGHDIEASWLLWEGAKALGDKQLTDSCAAITVNLATAARRDGLNSIGGMTIQTDHTTGQSQRTMQWWGQTENVNGCLAAWKITGDQKWLEAAMAGWQFIKDHFIDHKCGEWFRTLREDGTPVEEEPKCGMWNCPYHNSRMGFYARKILADK